MRKIQTNLRVFLWISIVLFMFQKGHADSFSTYILSGAEKGTTYILLGWSDVPELDGYNIYRKDSAGGAYPKTPLNSSPITRLATCADIKAIIPEGSDEWDVISESLTPIRTRTIDRTTLTRKGKFNPCDVGAVKRGSANWERLMILSRRYIKIAELMGLVYKDKSVVNGNQYWYEIRGVQRGAEKVLKSDLTLVAGAIVKLPAPANIQAEAGDNKVMITWDPVTSSGGYDVFRQKYGSATILQVNDVPVLARLTHHMNGDTLDPNLDGYIDYQHWDDVGNATTHDVDGSTVDGPKNGESYRYQVAARNILGQTGYTSSFSSYVTPQDTTPPGLPMDLDLEVVGNTMTISWSKVTYDNKGHEEIDGVKGYNIYRSASQTDMSPVKLNTSLITQPASPVTSVEYTDNSSMIISEYGEEEYYYRIDVTDNNNNTSPLSSAVSGHTDDVFPPDPPQGVEAQGEEEFIRILWDLNTEPDIEGYEIYRSLCDLGKWPDPREQDKTTNDYLFVLIGEIYHTEAKDSANIYGKASYNDYTVPVGSPICYAYWVKARDKSQNKSGSWPYPDLSREQVVCQRLRDRTPPPPPILTALQARDESVLIEWVAAPCQDMGAFHVYKADQESGPYKWIGGIKIELPPAPSTTLTKPYHPTVECACDSIPIKANDNMTSGSITEKNVLPKTIYCYKVTSVDQNGNESDIKESPPYSTFTFKSSGPKKPVIQTVQKKSTGCGLNVNWTPAYSSSDHMGFVVFRSFSEDGLYAQISTMTTANTFTDSLITEGMNYWYKVQAYDTEGRPSSLSQAKKGTY